MSRLLISSYVSTLLRRHSVQPWLLPLFVVIASLLVQTLEWSEHLRYQRSSTVNALSTSAQTTQWLRWIGAHFAHLGWKHALLNCAALLLIWELFFRAVEWYIATLLLFVSCITISAGLYLFSPDVEWYVGLSGVLHGLFAFGALRSLPQHKTTGCLLLGGLVVKLILEQTTGAITGKLFENDTVVVDAHLYGAVAGGIFFAASVLTPRFKTATP